MYRSTDIFVTLLANRAEFARLETGLPPLVMIQGKSYEVEGPDIAADDLERILAEIASHRQLREFRGRHEIDFMYTCRKTLFLVRASRSIHTCSVDIFVLHRWLQDRPPAPPGSSRPDVPLDRISQPEFPG